MQSHNGATEGGRCVAVRELPAYPIASIRTGQWVRGEGNLWSAHAPVLPPPAIDIGALRARAEPIAAAPFEVYLDGGRVVYVRDGCANGDAALSDPFFLHVFPADPADLPERRRDSGFANLDFEFGVHGATEGGRCVAVRALPAYGIASIHTGQWVRGEGERWSVEAAFGE